MLGNRLKLRFFILITATLFSLQGTGAIAADYKIDPDHSFIEFRIKHLGFSWLYGRFNTLSGTFNHDPAKPEANRFTVEIETASVDTRHAERDKHLRSKDFLDVENYPMAVFKSTKYTGNTDAGVLEGVFTLHGVSKTIKIDVKKVGEGKDPWKNYRAGFIGKTTLALKDFGIMYNLGPASETMELDLGVEGILQ